jgi:flagellar assembly factor FliW
MLSVVLKSGILGFENKKKCLSLLIRSETALVDLTP